MTKGLGICRPFTFTLRSGSAAAAARTRTEPPPLSLCAARCPARRLTLTKREGGTWEAPRVAMDARDKGRATQELGGVKTAKLESGVNIIYE